jgi:hypothetical protein
MEDDFLSWVLKYLLSADARHARPLRAAPGWNALDGVMFRRMFLSGVSPSTELIVLFSFAQVPTIVVGKAATVGTYLADHSLRAGPQDFEPAQRAALGFCELFLKAIPRARTHLLSKTDQIHWMD